MASVNASLVTKSLQISFSNFSSLTLVNATTQNAEQVPRSFNISFTGFSADATVALGAAPTGSITGSVTTLARMGVLMPGSNFAAQSQDTYYMALIAQNPNGHYDASITNYSALVENGDEVIGTGYTAGGVQLTVVGPVFFGTTGFGGFSPDPSWTDATFSAGGAMIYNSSRSNQCVAIIEFDSACSLLNQDITIVLPSVSFGLAQINIS